MKFFSFVFLYVYYAIVWTQISRERERERDFIHSCWVLVKCLSHRNLVPHISPLWHWKYITISRKLSSPLVEGGLKSASCCHTWVSYTIWSLHCSHTRVSLNMCDFGGYTTWFYKKHIFEDIIWIVHCRERLVVSLATCQYVTMRLVSNVAGSTHAISIISIE